MSKQSFEDIDMVPLLVFYANGKKKVDIIGFTRFASEISKLKNVDSMEFGSDVYQIETVDLLKQLMSEKAGVVCNFYRTNISQCLEFNEQFAKLCAKYKGETNIAFCQIDCDKHDELADFPNKTVPEILMLIKGEEFASLTMASYNIQTVKEKFKVLKFQILPEE